MVGHPFPTCYLPCKRRPPGILDRFPLPSRPSDFGSAERDYDSLGGCRCCLDNPADWLMDAESCLCGDLGCCFRCRLGGVGVSRYTRSETSRFSQPLHFPEVRHNHPTSAQMLVRSLPSAREGPAVANSTPNVAHATHSPSDNGAWILRSVAPMSAKAIPLHREHRTGTQSVCRSVLSRALTRRRSRPGSAKIIV
jgi:hypothetical protein